MWPRLPFRRARRTGRGPTQLTRTVVHLTSERTITTSLTSSHTWRRLTDTTDTTPGQLHLPTTGAARERTRDDGRTLTWDHPDTTTGGTLTLHPWPDSSTTITLTHWRELPPGTRWDAVTAHQHALDESTHQHARAWVTHLSRYGTTALGA